MHFPLTPPPDKPFDAVGFGLNAVDHLIVVPEYPAFDTKMRLLDHKQSAGGQTASAMVALRRLGLKTAYAGRFGSDPEGLFGLQTMKDEDVNIDFAEVGTQGPPAPGRGSAFARTPFTCGLPVGCPPPTLSSTAPFGNW